MRTILSILLIVVIISPGCVVQKPDSSYISQADYNTRRTVQNAHFRKRTSGFGVVVAVSATAAGAYLGSQSKMVSYYKGTELKNAPAADAAIGALAGLTLTYLVNYACGLNKKMPIDNPNHWLNRSNKNYLFVNGNNGEFEVMHKSAHDKYAVKTFKDVEDFTKAFPASPRTNDIFWMGGQTLERSRLPQLIDLRPENPYNIKIKYRYLILSPSTLDCIEAKNRYRELTDSAEIRAIEKIASVPDALAVEDNWPNSRYPDLLGRKYFAVASTTPQFIDIAGKYPFLDQQCEQQAAETVATFDDIWKHFEKWPKPRAGNTIEGKAITLCNRQEMRSFIEFYPEQYTRNARKSYIASAPSYNEMVSAANEYPGFISPPKSLDYMSLPSVEEHFNWLVSKKVHDEQFFTPSQLTHLKNDLLDNCLSQQFNSVSGDFTPISSLLKFKTLVDSVAWLDAKNREDGTKNYVSLIDTKINDYYRLEEYRYIMEHGDIEDKMNFCVKYPNSKEANSFTEELNRFINNNVQISEIKHWMAKGDGSWLNDLAETSRDFIHGGQDYNLFVIGMLKNYSNVPVKLTLSVDVIRLKTCGVSIFRGTSEDRRNAKNTLIIPPKEEMPFLCVYKNLSEGTVIGSGFLSAGCTYKWADEPVQITKSLYLGDISRQQMIDHIAWVRSVVNKGNIDRKLSPNEAAVQWVQNAFGIEPDGNSKLRIKNTVTGSNLSIFGIKGNGSNYLKKSITIDDNDYEDFDLPQGSYIVKSSMGDFNVDVKGRITHLIVKEKEYRVDYDDVD